MPGGGSFVAVDWGTTRLRAWLVDEGGAVIDHRSLRAGIMHRRERSFGDVFDEALGDWHQDGARPVLMAGMVGSRQGWVEAPYAPCPARLEDLVGHVLAVPERRNVFIVPGLAQTGPGQRPDVMRGEETQLFGLPGDTSGIAILPGTHSKWVRLDSGAILSFATFLTGELFDLLTRHSIIAAVMTGLDAPVGVTPAFRRGAGEAMADDGPGILQSLFTVRARGVLGDMSGSELPGYLSGLLVGAEFREGLRAMTEPGAAPADGSPIMLVGHEGLTSLYAAAAAEAGLSTIAYGEECGLAGLLAVARAMGLGQGRPR